MQQRLVLEDGTVLPGVGVGAPGVAAGEACFTTAMAGYEEAVTDPSYVAQVLCFAYPLVGTYGVDESRMESEQRDVDNNRSRVDSAQRYLSSARERMQSAADRRNSARRDVEDQSRRMREEPQTIQQPHHERENFAVEIRSNAPPGSSVRYRPSRAATHSRPSAS